MRSEKIFIQRPTITDTDVNEVVDVLKSGNLVQGKRVAELEKQISNYIGTNYCSATSNGTSTLHLALLTIGICPDDEIIVPAFSYVATANVVELVGAKPVFVDIDIDTLFEDVSFERFNIDVLEHLFLLLRRLETLR